MKRKAPQSHPPSNRVIVGISGASGTAYGIRLLEALRELGCESHAVATRAGEMTLGYELKMKRRDLASRTEYLYAIDDIAAPIASGSYRTLGMVVAPCSVHTMSQIATGVTANLLTRAADVCLKERRPLILMVRETPLHVGHLRTLTQLAEMGAIIAPPLPAFYAEPKSIDDLIDYSVGRVLDLLGFEWPIKRWESLSPKAGVKRKRDVMTDAEELALRTRLAELTQEHRDLDNAIMALGESGKPDQLQMTRLKKRKLQLKDEIARIENDLLPDIIA